MSCKCKGTIREPCIECYRGQLRDRLKGPEFSAWDLDAALGRAGLPGDTRQSLRGGFFETDATREAKAFFGAPRGTERILVLLGPTGRGKTVATGWLMREVLKDLGWNNAPTGEPALPATFLEASRLTGISERDKLDDDWLDELRRVRLLVVDDAGDEATSAGIAALSNLIKHRFGAGRRTAITSNLRKEAFFMRYGTAIGNRAESSRIAELPGKSMRAKPEARP